MPASGRDCLICAIFVVLVESPAEAPGTDAEAPEAAQDGARQAPSFFFFFITLKPRVE